MHFAEKYPYTLLTRASAARQTFNSAGVLLGGSVSAPKFLPRQPRLSRPVPDVSGPGRPQPPEPWEQSSGRTRPEGGRAGAGGAGVRARLCRRRGQRLSDAPRAPSRPAGHRRVPGAHSGVCQGFSCPLSRRRRPRTAPRRTAPRRPPTGRPALTQTRGQAAHSGAGAAQQRPPAPLPSLLIVLLLRLPPRGRRCRRRRHGPAPSSRGAALGSPTSGSRSVSPANAPAGSHITCSGPSSRSGEGGPRPPGHAQRRRPGRGGGVGVGRKSPATEARDGQDSARPGTACDRGGLGTLAVGVRHPSTGRPPALPLRPQDLLQDAFLPEERVSAPEGC